jgi:hypothetical protein
MARQDSYAKTLDAINTAIEALSEAPPRLHNFRSDSEFRRVVGPHMDRIGMLRVIRQEIEQLQSPD